MSPNQSDPRILANSRNLRHNQTVAEAKLWQQLRANRFSGTHFRRQHIIGNFIVDFCAPRHKLIVELDGGQHLDQIKYDQKRSEYLESKGYHVLRFWNNDVLNDMEGVLLSIMDALESKEKD